MHVLALVIGIRHLRFGPDNLGVGYMIDQGNTLVAAAAKAGGPAANYFAKVAVAVVHLVLGSSLGPGPFGDTDYSTSDRSSVDVAVVPVLRMTRLAFDNAAAAAAESGLEAPNSDALVV
jgi:hypothetical protein